MPATTPNRSYPYPIGTDPVDTAGDVNRLANAIDTDLHPIVQVAAVFIPATIVGGTAAPGQAANVMQVTIPAGLAGHIAIFTCSIHVTGPGPATFSVVLFDDTQGLGDKAAECVANIPPGFNQHTLTWSRGTPVFRAGSYLWQVQNWVGSTGDLTVVDDAGDKTSGYVSFCSPVVPVLLEERLEARP